MNEIDWYLSKDKNQTVLPEKNPVWLFYLDHAIIQSYLLEVL